MSSTSEFRETIAANTKKRIQSTCGNKRIIPTRAIQHGQKVLEDTGLAIILSVGGSGATTCGIALLSNSKNTEQFIVRNFEEFRICTSSKDAEPTCIFVDDPLGLFQVNDFEKDSWLKEFESWREGKQSDIQLIVTVKRHIANEIQNFHSDFKNNIIDLDTTKLMLTAEERIQMMRAMIRNCSNDWQNLIKGEDKPNGKQIVLSQETLKNISETVLSSGFPKLFRGFLDKSNFRKGIQHFACPKSVLDKIRKYKGDNDRENSAKFLTLVAMSAFGGRLDNRCLGMIKQSYQSTSTDNDNREEPTFEREEEPLNITVIKHYAENRPVIECIEWGLRLLNGVLVVKENNKSFCFIATCVKNAMLVLLGEDFPHFVLKICDSDFFKEFICSNNCFETKETCVKIDTGNESVCADIMKNILLLLGKGESDVIANNAIMSDQNVIQHVLSRLENIDQLCKLCTRDRISGRLFLVAILASKKASISSDLKKTFVYKLLQHSLWKLIRTKKNYREKAAEIEKAVLMDCCLTRNHDFFCYLQGIFNLKGDLLCLQTAVKTGCAPIVRDVLRTIVKEMTREEKIDATVLALEHYSKRQTEPRKGIVSMLLQYVPIDLRIEDRDSFIHYATKCGNVDMIKALGDFHGDINMIDFKGQTCLHLATELNKLDIVKIALENGANQRVDRTGRLPIHIAAERNNLVIMKLLYGFDCDIIFQPDLNGRYPLHLAAQQNSVKAAMFLIEKMDDIDPIDHEQKTPLHYAAESGQGGVVHFLLEKGADYNFRNKDGKLPLFVACNSENLQAVKRILRQNPAGWRHSDTDCLFAAVEKKQSIMFRYFINYDFDVNTININGYTLLQATIRHDRDCFNELMKERVDVNMPGRNEYPVHTAVRMNDMAILDQLIKVGAKLAQPTLDTLDTVLHLATEYGHERLVYFILTDKKGRQLLKCKNKKGEVPLHAAARGCNLKLCRTLLAYGAERLPINNIGFTPLSIAEFKLQSMASIKGSPKYIECSSVVRLLMAAGDGYIMETAV